uniref:Uncharacterized protein n=1 Tax=Peronospora matthiolae TaxID=2874970 RepID=A0AAV1UPA6_9STRA
MMKPNLSDIVIFGSTCTVHLHTVLKSLGAREKAAIITIRNDETKGYRVLLLKKCVVVVTQLVKNIGILNTIQNIKALKEHDTSKGQKDPKTITTNV